MQVAINLNTNQRELYDSLFINTSFTPGSERNYWNVFTSDIYTNGRLDYTPGDSEAVNGFYTVEPTYAYTITRDGFAGAIYDVREDNPNGINPDDLKLDVDQAYRVSFTGEVITYTFGSGLELSGVFFVAYSPWCANDVVGGGKAMDPVPEPTSMLLFGTGIAALAGIGRRKRRK